MEAKVKWNSKLSFTGYVRGHEIQMDTTLENGGLNRGPNPKELLLNSISACAGMDIVAILEMKKKFSLLSLDIESKAEMTKTKPSYFANIHLIFKLSGDLDRDSAIKACTDSMTKYCGVSYMLVKACPIFYDVLINGESVYTGESKF